MGVGGQHHAPAASSLRMTWYMSVYEARWAPGPVWVCVESFTPAKLFQLKVNISMTLHLI